ncbi:biotin/lipoyl-containing protein [Streptococcus merionis]|uniref:Methylmalonyl-CoA decarboxylase gamma chain n=1 Tax=Streptococcus merionis TaxID=400065 RepID=A0A239STV7_9STRE|nr:biotin/lipoyl-containing protein [Streptococcus merionis]SNU88689.1 methylmalonyl-CoA decarboxylase gamma chain [Streptococcus merionis]
MKNYHITVNGKTYDVTVEEVSASDFQAQPAAEPATSGATAAPASAGTPVNAPMPGTIIAVNVTAGEAVKSGQVLCILEAMKMENEIVAPEDGTVSEVLVTKGAQVEAGAVLVTL